LRKQEAKSAAAVSPSRLGIRVASGSESRKTAVQGGKDPRCHSAIMMQPDRCRNPIAAEGLEGTCRCKRNSASATATVVPTALGLNSAQPALAAQHWHSDCGKEQSPVAQAVALSRTPQAARARGTFTLRSSTLQIQGAQSHNCTGSEAQAVSATVPPLAGAATGRCRHWQWCSGQSGLLTV